MSVEKTKTERDRHTYSMYCIHDRHTYSMYSQRHKRELCHQSSEGIPAFRETQVILKAIVGVKSNKGRFMSNGKVVTEV